MSHILKKTKTKLFAEGAYNAIIKKIEVEDNKFESGKQSAVFTFQTNYTEYPGEIGWRILKSYGYSFHEKSNLLPVVERLIGRSIADDESFDLDTLVGTRCKVRIENKKGEMSGRITSRIVDIFPVDIPTSTTPESSPSSN